MKVRTTKKALGQRVSVTRSYTYKLNCENHGGPRFESREFFCCQTAECDVSAADRTADALQAFCKAQVLKAVNEELAAMKRGYAK